MQTRFTKPELNRTVRRYFPELEEELIEEMATIGEVIELREGTPVMQPGQQFRYMIFVLEGNVKIFREDAQGGEFYLYSLVSGKACALSLSCSNRQEASAVKGITIEDGIALLIPVECMERWLFRYKSWGRYVINSLHDRIEDILMTFDQVAFRHLDERLEFYLERTQQNLGTSILYLSHQQIATDLNTSREVISRLLKKLEQRGLILMHRNSIELLKPLTLLVNK